MLKFYFNLAPNPMKVALLLEELGAPYEAIPVDTRKGEQHTPSISRVNPNAQGAGDRRRRRDRVRQQRNPALPRRESGQASCPTAASLRTARELLSWLMFVASGIGPYSGQAVHFRHHAPEPKKYALNRYDFEAERHWKIIDARLAKRPLHGGRHVHDRRHGSMGLGAAGAARDGRRSDLGDAPEREAIAR